MYTSVHCGKNILNWISSALIWCSVYGVRKIGIYMYISEKGAVLTENLMFRDSLRIFREISTVQFNGFHTKHNLHATSNPSYYFTSFVKYPIITFVRHFGFSATPNKMGPWLGVELCTLGVHLNATPLHLIYKSVNGAIIRINKQTKKWKLHWKKCAVLYCCIKFYRNMFGVIVPR